MKKKHEEILNILDSNSKLDWRDQNNAVFTLGSTDKKFINGSLLLDDKAIFSININETNYSAPYLAKKFKSAATKLNMEVLRSEANLSFYASLLPDDQIWIYSDGYGALSAGDKITLPKGTEYFKSKNTQLLCNPAGNLKKSCSSVFMGYEATKCSPQSVTVSYAVFQLQ